ncbi:MAG: serine/threonine-protein kinase [Actinomycetes bacterium]
MVLVHPHISGLSDWRPLARGGFSVVWQARQVSLNRPVAVKVHQHKLDDELEQRRFLREAGVAGQLSGHPGIVTVHDAGILPDDRPYLVMELCPEGSLTRWVEASERPSEDRVRRVGVELADALAAAHARGVLHRDVKPANVLQRGYDHVGLADFGLAMVPGPDTELTEEVLEALTPAYAPPEALRMEPATEKGDVFSLAATMYALLAGRAPRAVDTRTQTVAEVVDTVAEPIDPLPDVHPGLMAVVMQALADDPQRRPTAAEFRDALRALDLGGREDPGQRAGAGAARRGPTRPRRRGRVLVGLLAALAAVALAAGLATQLRPSPGALGSAAPTVGPAVSSAARSPAESPAGSQASTPAETPSPGAGAARTPPPPGFVDCSGTFGNGALCPTEPECWNGVIAFGDALQQVPLTACVGEHIFQTFLAAEPTEPPRSQSALEADRRVRRLCRISNLEKLLPGGQAEPAWEVRVIPAQPDKPEDNLFRCLVEPQGLQTQPIELTAP